MANLAGVLKNEIRRLARKEVRASMVPLQRVVTRLRKRVAEQRKLMVELERSAKRSVSAARRERAVAEEGGPQIRFSPRWVRAHRKKLKMSRREYAELMGVSAQSIFGWETGRTRPRRKALETWRRLRSMGSRQIASLPEAEGRGRRKKRGRPAGRGKKRGRPAASKTRRATRTRRGKKK